MPVDSAPSDVSWSTYKDLLNRIATSMQQIHDGMVPLLDEDPTAIWSPPIAKIPLTPDTSTYRKATMEALGMPVDAYEWSNSSRKIGDSEISTWGGMERTLTEKYRTLHEPLRDFYAHNTCPHCDNWDCHWINLIPVPEGQRDEWGADEVLARICRACRLSWREAP
ncbi:hypothetical protein SEA_SPEEDDEMON_600 [Gordonia phage SpeedDemon]|nr:hypothetical protein SEA_SPEEDDEMON_600 [Gordonia phage SpeedDemon]